MVFKNGGEKDIHIKKAHSTPTFPCDMCKFVAEDDFELNRHLEIMHGFRRVNKKISGYAKD